MPATRNSYTFKEGLTMMAAKTVGIDPDLAVNAGESARAAINALRHAAKARNAKDKVALIRDAQKELQSISASQHPKLVNALQARLLALQGRGGDTEIAHLTPGEVVLPRSLQTPAIMQQIAAEARRQGVNAARLAVGDRANNVNPRTGQREFQEEIEEVKVIADRPQVHEGLYGYGGLKFENYGADVELEDSPGPKGPDEIVKALCPTPKGELKELKRELDKLGYIGAGAALGAAALAIPATIVAGWTAITILGDIATVSSIAGIGFGGAILAANFLADMVNNALGDC